MRRKQLEESLFVYFLNEAQIRKAVRDVNSIKGRE